MTAPRGRTPLALMFKVMGRMFVILDADVPTEEVERLAAHSYDLACADLTRKQRAELATLAG